MPDVAGVRHRFVDVDGVRLHVAEAGAAGKPAVLLLHGFPQHWYVWRDVIEPLGSSRHVVAIDLRGFGWSDAPARGYSTAARVRDVLAVMDQLGIGCADVIGHDWGGWLAQRLALGHPDRVERVVGISMIHPWPLQRHLAPATWRWWVTMLFEVPFVGEWVLRRHPRVTGWLLSRDARDASVWNPSLRGMYADVASEPSRAKAGRKLHGQLILHDIARLVLGRDRRRGMEVPTLLVVGDNDALFPASVLTVPKARAHTVKVAVVSGGHFVVDESPAEVVAAIREHLGLTAGAIRNSNGSGASC